MIMKVLTPSESPSAPKMPKKPRPNSLTQARARRENIVPIDPPIINGFRLPQDILQLSLRIPTYGCTSEPERGPAIQTRAIRDLLRPRDNRYGDPLDNSTAQAICRPPILIVNNMSHHALLVTWYSSCSSNTVWPSTKASSSPPSCCEPEADRSGDC